MENKRTVQLQKQKVFNAWSLIEMKARSNSLYSSMDLNAFTTETQKQQYLALMANNENDFASFLKNNSGFYNIYANASSEDKLNVLKYLSQEGFNTSKDMQATNIKNRVMDVLKNAKKTSYDNTHPDEYYRNKTTALYTEYGDIYSYGFSVDPEVVSSVINSYFTAYDYNPKTLESDLKNISSFSAITISQIADVVRKAAESPTSSVSNFFEAIQYNNTQNSKLEAYQNASWFEKASSAALQILATPVTTVGNMAEGLIDVVAGVVGSVFDIDGTEEFVGKDIIPLDTLLAEALPNSYATSEFSTSGWKTVYSISDNLVRIGAMVGISYLTKNPTIGQAVYYTSSAGNTLEDTINRGDLDLNGAIAYTAIATAIEIATEKISSDAIFGKGFFNGTAKLGSEINSKVLSKTMTGKTKWTDEVSARLLQGLMEAPGEGFEEVVSGFGSGVVYGVMTGDYSDLNAEDLTQAFIVGGISGGILGSATPAISYRMTNRVATKIKSENGEWINVSKSQLLSLYKFKEAHEARIDNGQVVSPADVELYTKIINTEFIDTVVSTDGKSKMTTSYDIDDAAVLTATGKSTALRTSGEASDIVKEPQIVQKISPQSFAEKYIGKRWTIVTDENGHMTGLQHRGKIGDDIDYSAVESELHEALNLSDVDSSELANEMEKAKWRGAIAMSSQPISKDSQKLAKIMETTGKVMEDTAKRTMNTATAKSEKGSEGQKTALKTHFPNSNIIIVDDKETLKQLSANLKKYKYKAKVIVSDDVKVPEIFVVGKTVYVKQEAVEHFGKNLNAICLAHVHTANIVNTFDKRTNKLLDDKIAKLDSKEKSSAILKHQLAFNLLFDKQNKEYTTLLHLDKTQIKNIRNYLNQQIKTLVTVDEVKAWSQIMSKHNETIDANTDTEIPAEVETAKQLKVDNPFAAEVISEYQLEGSVTRPDDKAYSTGKFILRADVNRNAINFSKAISEFKENFGYKPIESDNPADLEKNVINLLNPKNYEGGLFPKRLSTAVSYDANIPIRDSINEYLYENYNFVICQDNTILTTSDLETVVNFEALQKYCEAAAERKERSFKLKDILKPEVIAEMPERYAETPIAFKMVNGKLVNNANGVAKSDDYSSEITVFVSQGTNATYLGSLVIHEVAHVFAHMQGVDRFVNHKTAFKVICANLGSILYQESNGMADARSEKAHLRTALEKWFTECFPNKLFDATAYETFENKLLKIYSNYMELKKKGIADGLPNFEDLAKDGFGGTLATGLYIYSPAEQIARGDIAVANTMFTIYEFEESNEGIIKKRLVTSENNPLYDLLNNVTVMTYETPQSIYKNCLYLKNTNTSFGSILGKLKTRYLQKIKVDDNYRYIEPAVSQSARDLSGIMTIEEFKALLPTENVNDSELMDTSFWRNILSTIADSNLKASVSEDFSTTRNIRAYLYRITGSIYNPDTKSFERISLTSEELEKLSDMLPDKTRNYICSMNNGKLTNITYLKEAADMYQGNATITQDSDKTATAIITHNEQTELSAIEDTFGVDTHIVIGEEMFETTEEAAKYIAKTKVLSNDDDFETLYNKLIQSAETGVRENYAYNTIFIEPDGTVYNLDLSIDKCQRICKTFDLPETTFGRPKVNYATGLFETGKGELTSKFSKELDDKKIIRLYKTQTGWNMFGVPNFSQNSLLYRFNIENDFPETYKGRWLKKNKAWTNSIKLLITMYNIKSDSDWRKHGFSETFIKQLNSDAGITDSFMLDYINNSGNSESSRNALIQLSPYWYRNLVIKTIHDADRYHDIMFKYGSRLLTLLPDEKSNKNLTAEEFDDMKLADAIVCANFEDIDNPNSAMHKALDKRFDIRYRDALFARKYDNLSETHLKIVFDNKYAALLNLDASGKILDFSANSVKAYFGYAVRGGFSRLGFSKPPETSDTQNASHKDNVDYVNLSDKKESEDYDSDNAKNVVYSSTLSQLQDELALLKSRLAEGKIDELQYSKGIAFSYETAIDNYEEHLSNAKKDIAQALKELGIKNMTFREALNTILKDTDLQTNSPALRKVFKVLANVIYNNKLNDTTKNILLNGSAEIKSLEILLDEVDDNYALIRSPLRKAIRVYSEYYKLLLNKPRAENPINIDKMQVDIDADELRQKLKEIENMPRETTEQRAKYNKLLSAEITNFTALYDAQGYAKDERGRSEKLAVYKEFDYLEKSGKVVNSTISKALKRAEKILNAYKVKFPNNAENVQQQFDSFKLSNTQLKQIEDITDRNTARKLLGEAINSWGHDNALTNKYIAEANRIFDTSRLKQIGNYTAVQGLDADRIAKDMLNENDSKIFEDVVVQLQALSDFSIQAVLEYMNILMSSSDYLKSSQKLRSAYSKLRNNIYTALQSNTSTFDIPSVLYDASLAKVSPVLNLEETTEDSHINTKDILSRMKSLSASQKTDFSAKVDKITNAEKQNFLEKSKTITDFDKEVLKAAKVGKEYRVIGTAGEKARYIQSKESIKDLAQGVAQNIRNNIYFDTATQWALSWATKNYKTVSSSKILADDEIRKGIKDIGTMVLYRLDNPDQISNARLVSRNSDGTYHFTDLARAKILNICYEAWLEFNHLPKTSVALHQFAKRSMMAFDDLSGEIILKTRRQVKGYITDANAFIYVDKINEKGKTVQKKEFAPQVAERMEKMREIFETGEFENLEQTTENYYSQLLDIEKEKLSQITEAKIALGEFENPQNEYQHLSISLNSFNSKLFMPYGPPGNAKRFDSVLEYVDFVQREYFVGKIDTSNKVILGKLKRFVEAINGLKREGKLQLNRDDYDTLTDIIIDAIDIYNDLSIATSDNWFTTDIINNLKTRLEFIIGDYYEVPKYLTPEITEDIDIRQEHLASFDFDFTNLDEEVEEPEEAEKPKETKEVGETKKVERFSENKVPKRATAITSIRHGEEVLSKNTQKLLLYKFDTIERTSQTNSEISFDSFTASSSQFIAANVEQLYKFLDTPKDVRKFLEWLDNNPTFSNTHGEAISAILLMQITSNILLEQDIRVKAETILAKRKSDAGKILGLTGHVAKTNIDEILEWGDKHLNLSELEKSQLVNLSKRQKVSMRTGNFKGIDQTFNEALDILGKHESELSTKMNPFAKNLTVQERINRVSRIFGKMNSFRYMAMLSNPATQIKNVVGNLAATGLNKTSEKIAELITRKKAGNSRNYSYSWNTTENRDIQLENAKRITHLGLHTSGLLDGILSSSVSKYDDGYKNIKRVSNFDLETFATLEQIDKKVQANEPLTARERDIRNKYGSSEDYAMTMADFIKDKIHEKTPFGTKNVVSRGLNYFYNKVFGLMDKTDKLFIGKKIENQVADLIAKNWTAAEIEEYESARINQTKGFELTTAEKFAIEKFEDLVAYVAQDTMLTYYRSSPKIYKKIMQAIDNPVAKAVISMVVPFPRMLINVTLTAVAYSPLGFISALNTYLKGKDANSPFTQLAMSKQLGKATTGTLAMAIGAILAALGAIRLREEEEYLGPQLILFDKIAVNLNDLSPATLPLTIGATLCLDTQKSVFERLGLTAEAFLESIFVGELASIFSGNKTMLDIVKYPFEQYVYQMIPAVFKSAAKTIDPHVKDTSGNMKLFKKIASYIPGLSFAVSNKINPYTGEYETLYNESSMSTWWLAALNSALPMKVYLIDQTLVEAESEAVDAGTSGPSSTYSIDGEQFDIPKEQLSQYKQLRAKLYSEYATEIINTDWYKRATIEAKRKKLKSLQSKATKVARQQLNIGK